VLLLVLRLGIIVQTRQRKLLLAAFTFSFTAVFNNSMQG
jgi:hypothetical protein